MLIDHYHRTIDYLRISVTDRCNLNCKYCVGEFVPFFPHSDILSYEDIVRFVRIAARLGIIKVRLTGGEPLVRKGLAFLIRSIAEIKEIEDVGLTTNGVFLGQKLVELKEAGLRRVNISLDTLNRDRYQYITGVDALNEVLRGIEKSSAEGLNPIKINTVLIKGFNDDEILDFVKFAKAGNYQVRFIELMPFGKAALPKAFEVVPSSEIERRIQSQFQLTPAAVSDGGPARMFDIEGGVGKVGFISSVTTHLCSKCNRIRLTSNGKIKLCLFSEVEYDARKLIREGTDYEIEELIKKVIQEKPEKRREMARVRSCPRTLRNVGG